MSGFLEAVRLAVSSNDGESLSNYLSLIGLPFKSFQKMSETPLGKYVNPYFDAICAETLQVCKLAFPL